MTAAKKEGEEDKVVRGGRGGKRRRERRGEAIQEVTKHRERKQLHRSRRRERDQESLTK